MSDEQFLEKTFDSIVMLTWSNWHTEMRSNRYNYAVRFAQYLPVIFVQPDLTQAKYLYEKTEVDNVTILHVFKKYSMRQTKLLNRALLDKKIITPLFWIYNPLFRDFIFTSYSLLRIYHATEDYFRNKSNLIELDNPTKKTLVSVVEASDVLVSVSREVERSYLKNCDFTGRKLLLLNGCDFDFWNNTSSTEKQRTNTPKKIVFYQGGISAKIDFEMLRSVILAMKDWEFWFCGEISLPIRRLWNPIEKFKNVKYFGKLHPTEVRELAYKAGVAIIPFIQDEIIIKSSLPLKAFEYLAVGLPVVTVPIESLLPYSDVYFFAKTSDEFIEKIRFSSNKITEYDFRERYEIAKTQDYNKKFKVLIDNINCSLNQNKICQLPKKILFLCSQKLIESYLIPFSTTNYVFYDCPEKSKICYLSMHNYDILIIDSLLICDNVNRLHISYQNEIISSGKYKMLLIGDKEENMFFSVIEDLGIHQYISLNTIQLDIQFNKLIEGISSLTYPNNRLSYYQAPPFFFPILDGDKEHEIMFLKYLYFIILFLVDLCLKLRFLNYFIISKIVFRKILGKIKSLENHSGGTKIYSQANTVTDDITKHTDNN